MSGVAKRTADSLLEKVINDGFEFGHDILEFGRETVLRSRGYSPKPNQHSVQAVKSVGSEVAGCGNTVAGQISDAVDNRLLPNTKAGKAIKNISEDQGDSGQSGSQGAI